ncbi:MAG: type II secretion system protein E [Candidatus Omnitrophica bacterium CG23_combo_of_CG06-09_8_20_14_all_41_10]|uniref:Type II secretion system protein E n=1 Tax=Candidatus Sherwoodlollariibacterium unditelluris TaxID=1974757 RepID=A0A2G9YKT2_9BACT|nr:MAG: type II secretion system protein E [Candidatus Omnitrophica bacterium CG23_combo_of_CG06-09_8_20_14_all_41_10]
MDGTLKDKIRRDFIARYSSLWNKASATKEELKENIRLIIEGIVNRPQHGLGEEDKQRIIGELVDEFSGFGPIEQFMKDPSITEIMINGPKKVYLEKNGKKTISSITFDSDQQIMYVVQKMLAPTRRHIDESYPYVDISLDDGSRVNVIIPPLALDGPVVTIRKFLEEIRSVEDLIGLGTLDRCMADFLIACIKAKVNMLFSGATGSGKTTALGVLSGYINNDERIVTIEDTAELHLAQDHVIRLETRNPNIEGKGEVTIRDLFKNSLRMRPGRIILGEIRSSEALDMLQAMCSGHRGALAVIHAGSPQDVIHRLETMVLTSGIPITLEAVHRQIAAAVNLIIQQEQLPDGSRKITRLTQVNGIKDYQVILEDIFVYEIEEVSKEGKVKGRFRATGVVPVFYPLFYKAGINLPQEIFK